MDLYEVLGVSRAASGDQIERAYRRLARRYHPGVNPGDRVAEERFRQLEVAYGVLGDRDRRHEYDHGAAVPAAIVAVEATVSFEGFDFSSPAEGPGAATFSELFADVFQDAARRATAPDRGLEVECTLRLSFEDAVRGGQFPLSIVRHERCSACGGDGMMPRPPLSCPECGGQGTRRWARGHMVFTKSCEACDGKGALTHQPCRICGGAGVQPRSEVVTLTLPPGIDAGARLSVPGRGHATARGGVNGDLYVTIDVAEHPFFTRAGRDVHVTLPVAVHEAALGARVEVPTLDGPLRLRIPAGTSSGQSLRVRGRGVPSSSGHPEEAGDLVVTVQIVLPAVRDERSRELLKEFGRLNDVDVRKHLFGGASEN
jgi:molecular chaperone DnaJ